MSDSTSTASRLARRAAALVRDLQARLPFTTRVTRQIVAVNLLDSSARLAAQAFLTAIPVLFVVGAFAPSAVREQMLESARGVLGIGGDSLAQVRQVYGATDDTARDTSGAVGVLVTLVSATACSHALQRLCERSWHLPPAASGWSDVVRRPSGKAPTSAPAPPRQAMVVVRSLRSQTLEGRVES